MTPHHTPLDDAINNENPRDIILLLTRNNSGISYPRIDRLYSRLGWPHAGNLLNLMTIIEEMCHDGLIARSERGFIKGPNWHEPLFITESKYGFSFQ